MIYVSGILNLVLLAVIWWMGGLIREERLLSKAMLARYKEQTHELPLEVEELIEQARPMIAALEDWDASGEAKRHRVYADMIKANPAANKMDIDLAIACAIRKVRA